MNKVRQLVCVVMVSTSLLSLSAIAEDCKWTNTSLSRQASSTVIGYTCTTGSLTAATRTVRVSEKEVECSMTINSDFENMGSCTSPSIKSKCVPDVEINIPALCNTLVPSCLDMYRQRCIAAGGQLVPGLPYYTCKTVCS